MRPVCIILLLGLSLPNAMSCRASHGTISTYVMFRDVTLGDTYTETTDSPVKITLLEIDEAEQRCLFKTENTEANSSFVGWAKVKGLVRFSRDQITHGITLERIEKGKAIIGLRYCEYE